MTINTQHPGFEVLNDYVDGRLDAGARSLIVEHVSACSDCHSMLERLTDLLDRIDSVPDVVLPPDDLWYDVRAAIDQRKQVMLPISNGSGLPTQSTARKAENGRPWWARRAILAAAAVVLMVLSSGVTAIVLRETARSLAPADIAQVDAPGSPHVLPANFRRAEGEYLRSIDELRSTLQAQRATLRPETIAAVERSLTIVDAAIDEARTALLNDPSNDTLVDLLTASYERKLDLLRRAADLGART